jgi:hypothetical protein
LAQEVNRRDFHRTFFLHLGWQVPPRGATDIDEEMERGIGCSNQRTNQRTITDAPDDVKRPLLNQCSTGVFDGSMDALYPAAIFFVKPAK